MGLSSNTQGSTYESVILIAAVAFAGLFGFATLGGVFYADLADRGEGAAVSTTVAAATDVPEPEVAGADVEIAAQAAGGDFEDLDGDGIADAYDSDVSAAANAASMDDIEFSDAPSDASGGGGSSGGFLGFGGGFMGVMGNVLGYAAAGVAGCVVAGPFCVAGAVGGVAAAAGLGELLRMTGRGSGGFWGVVDQLLPGHGFVGGRGFFNGPSAWSGDADAQGNPDGSNVAGLGEPNAVDVPGQDHDQCIYDPSCDYETPAMAPTAGQVTSPGAGAGAPPRGGSGGGSGSSGGSGGGGSPPPPPPPPPPAPEHEFGNPGDTDVPPTDDGNPPDPSDDGDNGSDDDGDGDDGDDDPVTIEDIIDNAPMPGDGRDEGADDDEGSPAPSYDRPEAQELDMDGDGNIDAYGYDLDGDGTIDLHGYDTSTDTPGQPDQFDTDGDGTIDGFDTVGDGWPDSFDTDGDGVVDAFDTDGDGYPDDMDGDMQADGDANNE